MNNNFISQNVQNYFTEGIKKIIKVTPNDDYSLSILFDNGELKKYNMSDKLFGVFEILKDIDKFRQVFIDESGNIAWDKDASVDSKVVWNNRIDICKDSVYLNSTPVN